MCDINLNILKIYEDITILSLNTEGILAWSSEYFEKCAIVAQYCNTNNIDVINFQEVFFYHHLWRYKRLLYKFPYVIYTPALLGPKAGLVTFSRLPLQFFDYHSFRKIGVVYNASILNLLGRKGILISKFKDSEIYIWNIHMSANLSNKWNRRNPYVLVIKSQIEQFHKIVNQYGSNTCIISGDFNIPKKSSLYRLLIKNGVKDVFANINRFTHRGDLFISKYKMLQIDYIFYTQEKISVKRKDYVLSKRYTLKTGKKIFLSDHVGLQATLSIKI